MCAFRPGDFDSPLNFEGVSIVSESVPQSFLSRSASARHETDDLDGSAWHGHDASVSSFPSVPPKTGAANPPIGSYAEARSEAILKFERAYVLALLEATGGNVSEAARVAKMDRVYLHRLMRRHRTTRTSVTYGIADGPVPERSVWPVSPSSGSSRR